MDSVAPECTQFKKKYEDCFNFWYSEAFLKGNKDAPGCEELFHEYQDALKKKKIDSLLKEQGIDLRFSIEKKENSLNNS